MKFLRRLLLVIASCALILGTFFACFKGVVFHRPFINAEMEKYHIAADNKMTQTDLEDLFDETLKYLEFKRDDMVIQTVVDGVPREAYNDQEKQHMADCLGLFKGGYAIYHTSLFLCAAAIIAFLFLKKEKKPAVAREFSGTLLICYAVFFTLVAALGILFYSNFDKYFIMFHEIFFDNDLWIMDPAKCLMINLMPEDFFFDIVMHIAVIFLAVSILWMAAAVIVRTVLKKKEKSL